MFIVPLSRALHPFFKRHSWREAQITSGSPNIINAAMGEEFHTAACEWRIFALHARHKRENIGGKVCQPQGDIALRRRFAQRTRNSSSQFAKRDGMVSGNVV